MKIFSGNSWAHRFPSLFLRIGFGLLVDDQASSPAFNPRSLLPRKEANHGDLLRQLKQRAVERRSPNQGEEPNDRKNSELCEYASRNPLRIPKEKMEMQLCHTSGALEIITKTPPHPQDGKTMAMAQIHPYWAKDWLPQDCRSWSSKGRVSQKINNHEVFELEQ